MQRWAKEEVWSQLQGGGVSLKVPPLMRVMEGGLQGVVVQFQLPLESARRALWRSGAQQGVGYHPHIVDGQEPAGLGCVVHRVVVPEGEQGHGTQHCLGKLQGEGWFGGLNPDSTPRKLGIRCWATERRTAGEVGRDRIGYLLGFAVEGQKVRVRVCGHPPSFVHTAKQDVHRLVGPAVTLVGMPVHVAASGLSRPVFDVALTGLPLHWAGSVLEQPAGSRSRTKRYVVVRAVGRAASYKEVRRGQALPLAAAPTPLMDEGGASGMAVDTAEEEEAGAGGGMEDDEALEV